MLRELRGRWYLLEMDSLDFLHRGMKYEKDLNYFLGIINCVKFILHVRSSIFRSLLLGRHHLIRCFYFSYLIPRCHILFPSHRRYVELQSRFLSVKFFDVEKVGLLLPHVELIDTTIYRTLVLNSDITEIIFFSHKVNARLVKDLPIKHLSLAKNKGSTIVPCHVQTQYQQNVVSYRGNWSAY